MSIFDAMMQVENQSVQLERARAVLAEAEYYFEGKDDVRWLPHYAEHILLLLHVVDNLLFDTLPELNEVTEILLTLHKNQKGEE